MNITIQDDWYKNFFVGLNCEMWLRGPSPEWTEQEVNFLQDVLNCPPGAKLLDIPCGYGRHAIALAKRGFAVTGVDISVEFLQLLAKQVQASQLPVQIIQGDVTDMMLPPVFDGGYCLGNSFGYVDYEGMTRFICTTSAALKPGARFVINSGLVAESILPDFPKTKHFVLGDLTMDIINDYQIDESCMLTELTYTQAEHVEKHYFKHYVYTLSEIKRLLAQNDLQTIAVYGSTGKQPYQLGDRQVYLVAEKR